VATKGLISAGAKKSAKEREDTTENKELATIVFCRTNKGNCEKSERTDRLKGREDGWRGNFTQEDNTEFNQY
jgi:hypothetical protein